MTDASRRTIGTLLMWLAPLAAIVLAVIVGVGGAASEVGPPSACGGNCEQRLAEAAAHRQLVVTISLVAGGVLAIVGWIMRASSRHDR